MQHRAPVFSPLAIAPMIDWTDTYFRMFMRILAPHALLYTEMQTTPAITYQPDRALLFDEMEHPIALQVGGSDPKELARVAKIAEARGFDEINLNLGCPSDRVIAGHFGACLMKEANLVVQCVEAMKNAVNIPVTAKTRIGVDSQDSFEFFESFVSALHQAGIDKLVTHARKAWLKGLSPKQNRTIPPINYEYVYRIKSILTVLPIVINGNIETIDAIHTHLQQVEGVMIGRLACNNPYAIAQIHHALYPDSTLCSRSEAFSLYFAKLNTIKSISTSMHCILKPILNISHGLPGAKAFKQDVLNLKDIQDNAAITALSHKLRQMEKDNQENSSTV